MKKIMLLTLLLFINDYSIMASNDIGLTQDSYSTLCGVWDLQKSKGSMDDDFSWGNAKFYVNDSFVIDLGDDSPYLLTPLMGKLKIVKIYKNNEVYVIRFLFRDNKQYNLEINAKNKDEISFNQMMWFKDIPILIDTSGKNNKYFKNDGPKNLFFKSKISNLRLREQPILNSKVLYLLDNKTNLLIIKKGAQDTVDGLKGQWVKVLTDKDVIGWCFDYYLQK